MRSGFNESVYKNIINEYERVDKVSLKVRDYRSANKSEKGKLFIESVKVLRDQNLPKYQGYSWEYILVQHARLKVNPKWKAFIFGHSSVESYTYPVLRKFLSKEYDRIYSTYNKKRERWPDFFALNKGILGSKTTFAIESKVNYNEIVRFLDQATEFMRYSNYVYLATTPELIIEIGEKPNKLVQCENILREKLKKAGVGLIVIDMTANKVKQVIESPESTYLDKKERETRLAMVK